MDRLTALPNEVLHSILAGVNPKDLATLSRTCRTLHNFISDNRPLFKDVYLGYLDNPELKDGISSFNYEKGLHSLVKLQRYCGYGQIEQKLPHLEWVADVVSSLLETASPKSDASLNISLLVDIFSKQVNKDGFLTQSTLFERARGRINSDVTKDMHQASAKLHVLCGVPILRPDGGRVTRQNKAYPYAASIVYDLRNYTAASEWGPFLDDGSGRVDWEKLEAVMIVLGHNLRLFSEGHNRLFRPVWATPFSTTAANSYVSRSIAKNYELPPPIDAMDPYHVSGTWMRVVCFLGNFPIFHTTYITFAYGLMKYESIKLIMVDFNDLFAYNFNVPQPGPDEPRAPLDTTEAIRLIVMELEATKIEAPGEDDSQDLPIVHFKGVSRPMHTSWDPNANSAIRGTIRKTKHGDIRWTTFSIYAGQARWRSESVQLGGLNSARGSIGHWFDKDYDVHGPAGPTAFWKISDEIEIRDEDENNQESEDEVGDFVGLIIL
ncbi:hypothetical protein F5884DRAFT_749771 [Xylogone sp. PMI_703]|nr:hypothetical protein F5884DRAFT_749771 [Xylogone sp. PMI_703]